ncbi:putative TBC1 domain family member 22A [Trypanosoma grayi]|uniref:putative TBC1 domain family member 22A n=1 Tax=Trypanosoma grayi TaxID=71804 RepID=UPI0004F450AF|nr:putative TBC1 domain family member 22A [Trypanosoma grayi]KEG14247.1 putative TBC1 domain family member 22A [Trypanosoma grayi]
MRATHEGRRPATKLRGPGVAVRAPPGTKYRVYGLMVVSGNTASARASALERHSVYVSNLDSDEEATHGTVANTPSAADAAPGASGTRGGGASSVREHDRMLGMVLALPLGDSPEGRATVRGYTWSSAVPAHVRPDVWRLLCGCVPCAPASLSRQQAELRRKRAEYENFVAKYYRITITDFMQPSAQQHAGPQSVSAGLGASTTKAPNNNNSSSSSSSMDTAPLSPDERAILWQIALDLPRHTYALFRHPNTASALARCLFLWSRRYPAVGYVQGIDDIMAVFFFVFLEGSFSERNIRLKRNRRRSSGEGVTDYTTAEDVYIPETVVFTRDVGELGAALQQLPVDLFKAAEADAYLCGGFFLSWLQDNFVQGQPGLLRSMALIERLLAQVDSVLLDAVAGYGISLMDCCFQWVHCLLARELPLELLVVLWEKYLAIGNSETVMDFHAYVCAVLLMDLRDNVLDKSVDVVLQRLKDPLGVRGKQKQQQKPLDGVVYDRRWIDKIIAAASRLCHLHPASSLA